jgi:hypothetical protein
MRTVGIAVIALVLMAPSTTNISAQANQMSFFITSANPGKGADLGGLAGADAHCAALAKAAGAPATRVWRAYLSTTGDKPVNAKDRIGAGPWFNAKGVQVAANVADLHSDNNKLSKENSLNEKGEVNNGRGDQPNRHDILTGSNLDGTAATATCNNWTNGAQGGGGAQVGHHDRTGGGQNPTSWNSAHATPGCSIEELRKVGGEGFFYCFAAK